MPKYEINDKITDTLQGAIYIGKSLKTNEKVIIKKTNKKLHKLKIAEVGQKLYHVKEDIIKETNILLHLQNNNPPKGFIKIYDFLIDDKNYFLIMQYGGECLFNYIVKCHKMIQIGKLKLNAYGKII